MRGSGCEVLRLVKTNKMAAKANSYGSDGRLNKEAKSKKECMYKQKENGKNDLEIYSCYFWTFRYCKPKFF